jgi:hypothetical protein
MSEENTGAAPSGGNATPKPAAAAADGTTADRSQAENPRARGYSPRDAREQPEAVIEPRVKINDVEYSESQVRDALAFKSEQEVRKQTLPQSPSGYEIKLPADFKTPEGVRFEFDKNDPGLARFQQLAHARGMDQQTFSDALGVYAANKIAEQQRLAPARAAELSKLGSAAEARIGAVETWLKARIGTKANLIGAQLRNFPVASMVEGFEEIMQQFSRQGGADFTQQGRSEPERPTGKIPGYENMSFTQRRVAQTAEMLRSNPAMANRAREK